MIQSKVIYNTLSKQLVRIRGSTGINRKRAIEEFKVIVRTAIKDGVDISDSITLIDTLTTMEKDNDK